MTSLSRLDAVAQADLVRRGEVSASELVDACLRRIEAMNPLIHAVVALDEGRRPVGTGPLAGVPFLIKDVTPYPGLRWALGSRLLRKNMPAPPTPYTARIDAAGLVTVGKTATSEFGLLGSTETLLEGITHNPWDLSFSAAGSSGGAAAAVASGMVPFAHANDGGGSIRIPASVCGLFGFKPSRGRTVPAVAQASDFTDLTSDHVISRSVRDSALFLSLTETAADPVGYVRDPIDRPLRIAAWSRAATGEEPDPEVAAAHARTLRILEDLGHHVEPVTPPFAGGLALGEAFFILAGTAVGGLVAMMPALRGRPVDRDELEPFTWGVIEAAQRRGPGALAEARALLDEHARRYLALIEPFDVVATPVLATPPWRIGHLSPVLPHEELMRRMARSVGYTPIHNIAGCPAMSVPLHFPEGGLPIGSHFAAAPGRDALLLQLAYQIEAAHPFGDRWAPWSYPMVFER